MKFKDTRGWIGKVGGVAIFGQITAVMLVPSVSAEYNLLLLEVSILSAVLGLDIVKQGVGSESETTQTIVDLLKNTDQENDRD